MDAHTKMLVRLAHDHPHLRTEVMPLIQQAQRLAKIKEATGTLTDKQAFSDQSARFVSWCLMKRARLSDHDCQKILDRVGIPLQEGPATTKRGPLAKGEKVKCQKVTNTNLKNTEVCEDHDGQTGVVTDLDGDAVIVTFDYGKGIGRFEDGLPGKTTGLGRWTPVSETHTSRASLEVVYISEKNDKPPSALSVSLTQKYVENGLKGGENRQSVYHTGVGTKQAFSKEGKYYFAIFSSQRDKWPRNISPTKGEVHYLGLLGKRPNWEPEFEQMLAEAGEDA